MPQRRRIAHCAGFPAQDVLQTLAPKNSSPKLSENTGAARLQAHRAPRQLSRLSMVPSRNIARFKSRLKLGLEARPLGNTVRRMFVPALACPCHFFATGRPLSRTRAMPHALSTTTTTTPPTTPTATVLRSLLLRLVLALALVPVPVLV